jgi:hypothetical protein
MTQHWTTRVEEDDDGELLITFPDELMQTMNWQEGDVIVWNIGEDGTISLTKKEQDGKD